MIIDAHIHCSGKEDVSDILRALDHAGIDRAVLVAPFLNGMYSMHSSKAIMRANRYLARLVQSGGDRLIGFGILNPSLEGAGPDLALIGELGLRGLKMVPSGWYPYDDCAHRTYERAAAWGMPILFHSGIFIDGRSGRFCRPVFYEIIRHYPRLRVTLAHLGWPWVDEAIAVGMVDLINGIPPDRCQFRFDISFGAPPACREKIVKQALSVLPPDLLQFGSNAILPCTGHYLKGCMDEVRQMLASLDVGWRGHARIMGGTAEAWLKDNPS